MMLRFVLFVFMLLMSMQPMAQQMPDNFLLEVYAIKNFKINSSLKDIQNNKQLAEKLSFLYRTDNRAIYELADQQVNLPGLKSLDRLAFDKLELTFENNRLHDVMLYIPNPFKNAIFEKTLNQFNTKYGHTSNVKETKKHYKKYIWNLGTRELIVEADSGSFIINYRSKISSKKVAWLYTNRKGEGNGTMQFTLSYLENLLAKKLTIASFEKTLPQWETTGTLNHLNYDLDYTTLTPDRPVFFIAYSLKNYHLEVATVDTTSKVLNEITLGKIKDPKVYSEFEKELANFKYIMNPKPKQIRADYYSNSKFIVRLDKQDSSITVMNDFKTKLP